MRRTMAKPMTKTEWMNWLEKAWDEAQQREWVGLTDEEIKDLWSWAQSREAERCANTGQHAFAKAIEAKLKEKNG